MAITIKTRNKIQQRAKKRIPEFSTWVEEVHWWETHSLSDYIGELEEVDVQFSQDAFPQPKKLTKTINVRLEPRTLVKLRVVAGRKGVGTATLARMWILEGLRTLERKVSLKEGL